MTAHAHSIAALQEGRAAGILGRRATLILMRLRQAGRPLTDRDLMVACGMSDPNAVRPRITEMVQDGWLAEVGSTRDPFTGKTVRLVDFASSPAADMYDALLREGAALPRSRPGIAVQTEIDL